MRDPAVPDRLPYVDGLRAVAVLGVVVYHTWIYAGSGGQPLVARLLQMGAHGVDLFFVLSGFCLAHPYLRRARAEGSLTFRLAAFAAKRITRIVPPYWLALTLVVALGAVHLAQKPPPVPEIVAQVFLLDRDVHYVAAPFWTLPIEFRWYFIFPLALFAFVRAPRSVLALAVCSYILYDFSRAHETIDFGTLPAFLGGIWLADLHLKQSPILRLALPVFLVYGLLAFALEPDTQRQFYAAEPLGVLAMMAFVALAGTTRVLRNVLAHPALRTIGAASYGIYLLHDPVLKELETVVLVPPGIACIAAIGVSLAFSWLCEQPFVAGRMRDRIVRALESRFVALGAWMGIPDVMTLPVPQLVERAAFRPARSPLEETPRDAAETAA